MYRRRRSRTVLAWTMGGFIAVHLGLAWLMECHQPILRDREYGTKLALLQQRIAEEPDRPLILVLGSSRVAVGLHPDDAMSSPSDPLVFNFGILGAGPMMEQVVLDRLLRQGIRPANVILEVWPPVMHRVPGAGEEVRMGVNRFGLRDALLISRHAEQPGDFLFRWAEDWFLSWHSNRHRILAELGVEGSREDKWDEIEADGWRGQSWQCPPQQVRELSHRIKRKYRTTLAKLDIDDRADAALREAIDRCHRADIPVTLLFMPESREFQGFYPAAIRQEVEEYLQQLKHQCHVEILDCRHLVPDVGFPDSFHLSPAGAKAFSTRFTKEMLPRLSGRF